MANKRKYVIGRKKKQFDHRINFKTMKTGSETLGKDKLIALLKDTLNHEDIEESSSSDHNENVSFFEDEDKENANLFQDEIRNDMSSDVVEFQGENDLCNRFNNQVTEGNYNFFEDSSFPNEVLDIETNEVEKKDMEYDCNQGYSACHESDVEESIFENNDTDGKYNHRDEHHESDMDFSEYDSESECESDMGFSEDSVTSTHFKPQGNRIADLNFVFDQIKEMNSHSDKCNFNDMSLLSGHEENKRGFNVSYTFICSKCSHIYILKNTKQSDSQLDLNYAAVFASFSVGIGCSQLQEFTGVLGIPSMAQSTFVAHQKEVLKDLDATAEESMALAAEAEKQNAISNGCVDQNGTPLIKAYIDTAWAKRSYGSGYSSLSGTASMIGHHTKKVIWNGVADKYCVICTRIASKNLEPYDHDCNTNYAGASTGMESKLAVDGFRECEEMYGFRIEEIIADGDSNVLAELHKANLYKYPMLTTRKLECCNHLFKNAIKKLMKLAKRKELKPYLTRGKVDEIIKGIRSAKDHWTKSGLPQSTQIENLRHDILNAPAHVFGCHDKCADYFCKKKDKNEPNIVNIMIKNKTYNSILDALSIIRVNARSILIYENTNVIENLHSLIAKYTGGKRVNFTRSKSYKGRTRCAVIQHNTRRLYSTLCEHKNKTPQPAMNILEFKRIRQNLLEISKERKYVPKRIKASGPDCSYGACDKSELEFDLEKELFSAAVEDNFKIWNDKQTTSLVENDRHSNSMKALLLTATHFGAVCTARSPESFDKIVSKILYEETETANQIDHQTTYKSHALRKLEELKNITVAACGLYIDQNVHTLGATPDGLVGANGIVIIKCPISTFEIEIEKSILIGNLPFWKKQNKRKNCPEFVPAITGINKKHKWYFEAQGLLHITQRNYCYLVVWASDELPLRVESIEKDDNFWKANMEDTLKTFYEKVLLLELVDHRASRKMPIRKFDRNYVCVA